METFKFPHETEGQGAESKEEKIEFEIEGETPAEVEVVDDTPEVDRGRAPMKEPPAEVTDDELSQYTEGVRKRIQHFSKGYHEERRAKEAAQREREEALKLAQSLVEENKRLQGNLGQSQQTLIEQAKRVIQGEVDTAKRKLKEAHEAGDTEAFVAAQEELAKAVAKAERVSTFKPVAKAQEDVVKPAPTPEAPPPAPSVDPKARAWQSANPWFGPNRGMTAYALAVHQDLVDQGTDVNSDTYYEQINKAVRERFPEAFPSEKPKKTVVAPATRSTAPKKIVLTQSQVNIAKRLGLTVEQYARALADQMRKENA
jgi:hypothetical protein